LTVDREELLSTINDQRLTANGPSAHGQRPTERANVQQKGHSIKSARQGMV